MEEEVQEVELTMNLIDVLCRLPTILSSGVLSVWLELKAVVSLDTACCTTSHRTVLQEMFQSEVFILKGLEMHETHHLRWVYSRSIRVLGLSVCAGIDSFIASKYLQKVGKYVRSVHLARGCSAHDVNLLVAQCRFLHSLTIDAVNAMAAVRDLLRCNRNVSTVRFHSFGASQSALFEKDSFPNVKTLRVVNCNETRSFPWRAFAGASLENLTIRKLEWIKAADITTLTIGCPKLRRIDATDTRINDDQLSFLAQTCVHMTYLNITNNDAVTDAGILSIVQSLLHLQHLEIGGCENLTKLSFKHILSHCAQRLTALAVDINRRTIGAFIAMLPECRSLLAIDLSLEPHMTVSQDEVESIFCALRNIRAMVLSGALLQDKALCLVGKYCHHLERLKISNARLDLSSAPLALSQGCPGLKVLVLDDLRYIGACALQFWMFLRPELRCFLPLQLDTTRFIQVQS